MTIVTSNFDGAESPISESGKFVSGPNSWSDMLKAGGILENSVGSYAYCGMKAAGTFSNDQYVQARLANTDLEYPALLIRIAAASGNGYGATLHRGGTDVYLQRFTDSGSMSEAAMGATVVGPSRVDNQLWRIEMTGTTFTLICAGSTLATRTDSNYASGAPGLGGFSGGANGTGWYDFEGGDLGGGGGDTDTLTASGGSVALTGGAAGIEVRRRLAADAGSLALTGGAANLKVRRKVVAQAGSLALSGAAVLRALRLFTADGGSFSIQVPDVSIGSGVPFPLEPGSLAFSGGDATLRVRRALIAAAGSVTITGGDADVREGEEPPPPATGAPTQQLSRHAARRGLGRGR